MIFNEFLETFDPLVLKGNIFESFRFQEFELKLKILLFIYKDFNFFNIFIESKWGVFPYLHLCFKVNGE